MGDATLTVDDRQDVQPAVEFIEIEHPRGSRRRTLLVEDETGSTCSDTVSVAVGTPPTLTLTSPLSGDVVTLGDSVSFAGTVEDQEDIPSDISITWVSDIDGTFSTQGSDSSGNIAFGFSDLTAGQHNLSITATDSNGLTAIVAQIHSPDCVV